jgi:hypothetical protein
MADLTDGPVLRRVRRRLAIDSYLTTASASGHLLIPNRPAGIEAEMLTRLLAATAPPARAPQDPPSAPPAAGGVLRDGH